MALDYTVYKTSVKKNIIACPSGQAYCCMPECWALTVFCVDPGFFHPMRILTAEDDRILADGLCRSLAKLFALSAFEARLRVLNRRGACEPACRSCRRLSLVLLHRKKIGFFTTFQ